MTTYADGIDLLIRFDAGDPDLTPDELGDVADFLLATGLVNSTGTYQRFVRDWIEAGRD